MINFTLKVYLQINDWKVLGLHEKYLLAFTGVLKYRNANWMFLRIHLIFSYGKVKKIKLINIISLKSYESHFNSDSCRII